MSSSKKTLVTIAVAVTAVAAVACTARIDMGDVLPETVPPTFTDPSSLDASVIEASTEALACIGTECPAPWETCPSEDGSTYKCGTDLKRDPNNCGACGNKCLAFEPIHMRSRCVNGACELECMSPPWSADWRDCNGLVDDGCEVDVINDSKHCGVCGNACAAGKSCIDGKCGCPDGLIECDGTCVDPKNDDWNCGACGKHCEPPDDACEEMPANAYYGCHEGQCGALKCDRWAADCNGDLGTKKCGSDGCEIASLTTRENCGACGNACAPGLDCMDEGLGPACRTSCEELGQVFCGGGCVDLLNDPDNCGGCWRWCKQPDPKLNQVRSCNKGICALDCAPGFADCNGEASDGCETNIGLDATSCGACGAACDLDAGQPCIEGKCLQVPCDGGVTTR